jgi:hypothetical protein
VPSLLPRKGTRAGASESERNLLDYLLGP